MDGVEQSFNYAPFYQRPQFFKARASARLRSKSKNLLANTSTWHRDRSKAEFNKDIESGIVKGFQNIRAQVSL
jgi:hypothetical protein